MSDLNDSVVAASAVAGAAVAAAAAAAVAGAVAGAVVAAAAAPAAADESMMNCRFTDGRSMILSPITSPTLWESLFLMHMSFSDPPPV